MKNGLLSLVTVLALGGCVVEDDDGNYSINWAITIDGRAATCAEVGATAVSFVATLQGTSDAFEDVFNNCDALRGTTSDMPEGLYTVNARLVGPSGAFGPSVTFPIEVFAGETTVGGTANFPFTFAADVSFRVEMGAGTSSNCGTTQTNGAGVAVEEIRLFSATGNTCLDADLLVGSSSEATCELLVCEEDNVVHTLLDLPGGVYDIQVLGYKGATGGTPYLCYASAEIRVTVAGQDQTLANIVAPFLITGADPRCDATKPESP